MVLVKRCLNEILDEGLSHPDDILKALDLFKAMYELVHGRLALGEFYLSVLVPEVVAAHHGIDVAQLFLLALEELRRQGVEGVVGEACIADDGKFLQEGGEGQLGEHVVDGEHPR